MTNGGHMSDKPVTQQTKLKAPLWLLLFGLIFIFFFVLRGCADTQIAMKEDEARTFTKERLAELETNKIAIKEAKIIAEQIATEEAEKAKASQLRALEAAKAEISRLEAELAKTRLVSETFDEQMARLKAEKDAAILAANVASEKTTQILQEAARKLAECNAAARQSIAVAPRATSLNAFGETIGDFFGYTLPNASEIWIPKGGFEETFANALADGNATDQYVLDRLFFDSGSASLSEESMDQINHVISILIAHPDINVRLRGHTDNTGSATGNKALSEARADSVRNAIVNGGISADRITVLGMGPSEPIASNDTDTGKRKNRRIDISVVR